MSFSPLPDILRSDLARLRGEVVLELGAGDGRFTQALAAEGVDVVCLDRRFPAAAGGIAGDALALPLRPGAVGVIVAANLLHLLGGVADAAAAATAWTDCLAPDGCLHVLQDDPWADTPARRNDRKLREWLARLVPSRGRLISLQEWRDALAAGGDLAGWSFGRELNRAAPPQRETALALLRGEGGEPDRPTAALAAAIARDGIDYGWYWWARWRGEAAP